VVVVRPLGLLVVGPVWPLAIGPLRPLVVGPLWPAVVDAPCVAPPVAGLAAGADLGAGDEDFLFDCAARGTKAQIHKAVTAKARTRIDWKMHRFI
jgi:hypothetical protein